METALAQSEHSLGVTHPYTQSSRAALEQARKAAPAGGDPYK